MATANPTPVIFDEYSRQRVDGARSELAHIHHDLNVVAMAINSLYDRELNQPRGPESVAPIADLAATVRRIAGAVLVQVNELETLPAMCEHGRRF